MIIKIALNIISFILFIYIFLFKLIKKNDTSYVVILSLEAIGILIYFIQILSNKISSIFITCFAILLSIVLPIIIFLLEYKKIIFGEFFYSFIARIYIHKKDYKKAKDILINLVSKYNESYIGHKLLAYIYEKEGGMRKAIDEYVKVLDIRKNDYKSYYKISLLLKDLGKNDEAIEMLKTLVKQKPDFENASEILGKMLYEKEEYKEAINIYSNALKLNSDNENILYQLGFAYCKTNNFPLAKKAFERVVDINNNNYSAYYRLGQISLLYRDFDSAENYFMQSANREYEAKAYFELAKIFIIKNKKEKAVIYINKSIEVEPSFFERTKSEPILFCIKNQIKEIKISKDTQEKYKINKEEEEIEDYLNNTYNLTKTIQSETKEEKNKFKKFKWEN